jgi:hypothetical protein
MGFFTIVRWLEEVVLLVMVSIGVLVAVEGGF